MAKTLIRLGGCQGWSETFAGRTCDFVGFVMRHVDVAQFVCPLVPWQKTLHKTGWSGPAVPICPTTRYTCMQADRFYQRAMQLKGYCSSMLPNKHDELNWTKRAASTQIKTNLEMIRIVRKRTLRHMRPAMTQINLRIRAVWSESSLGALWIDDGSKFLQAGREDSDQTARMRRLIWVFTRRTCH